MGGIVTKRRGDPEPMFKRRQQDFTPAQLARQREIGEEINALARDRYPERFAPDGSPLILYPGRDWNERRYAWRAQNGYPGLAPSDSFGAEGSSRDGGKFPVAVAVVGDDLRSEAGTPS